MKDDFYLYGYLADLIKSEILKGDIKAVLQILFSGNGWWPYYPEDIEAVLIELKEQGVF